MKPLEVWTCQMAENLKKKSSKIPKDNYAATMVSAARRQIIGGGSAPINKSRRRRRPQIVGGGGAAGARLYIPSCFMHIRDLRRIRPMLDFKTASTIDTSIVHSKLDYCNSLFLNLDSTQIQRLQL